MSQLSPIFTSITSEQILSNNVIFHQKMMYVVLRTQSDILDGEVVKDSYGLLVVRYFCKMLHLDVLQDYE